MKSKNRLQKKKMKKSRLGIGLGSVSALTSRKKKLKKSRRGSDSALTTTATGRPAARAKASTSLGENEDFGGCKGGCMTNEEHTEARSVIKFPSLCARKAVRNNMFTRT